MSTELEREIGTKVCRRCGKELPLNEYYKDKKTKCGHVSVCKECRREIQRTYYHSSEEVRQRHVLYSRKHASTFGREKKRGNGSMTLRDYELTEGQRMRRELLRRKARKQRGDKKYTYNVSPNGVLVQYDGQLDNVTADEYMKVYKREYMRQLRCAIRGMVGRVEPSEHFLIDFDLEEMLKKNVYYGDGKHKTYIRKWWEGEIRHWTVKDGIWKKTLDKTKQSVI